MRRRLRGKREKKANTHNYLTSCSTDLAIFTTSQCHVMNYRWTQIGFMVVWQSSSFTQGCIRYKPDRVSTQSVGVKPLFTSKHLAQLRYVLLIWSLFGFQCSRFRSSQDVEILDIDSKISCPMGCELSSKPPQKLVRQNQTARFNHQ